MMISESQNLTLNSDIRCSHNEWMTSGLNTDLKSLVKVITSIY